MFARQLTSQAEYPIILPMSALKFDTLKLAHRLREEADFPQRQAEATAAILADTLDESLVTRAHLDLKFAELDLKFAGVDAKFAKIDARFMEVDARFAEMETKIDARFKEIDARFTEMDAKIDARFKETDAKIEGLDTKIERLEAKVDLKFAESEARLKHDMTIRFGGMMAASVAVLAVLMKIL